MRAGWPIAALASLAIGCGGDAGTGDAPSGMSLRIGEVDAELGTSCLGDPDGGQTVCNDAACPLRGTPDLLVERGQVLELRFGTRVDSGAELPQAGATLGDGCEPTRDLRAERVGDDYRRYTLRVPKDLRAGETHLTVYGAFYDEDVAGTASFQVRLRPR